MPREYPLHAPCEISEKDRAPSTLSALNPIGAAGPRMPCQVLLRVAFEWPFSKYPASTPHVPFHYPGVTSQVLVHEYPSLPSVEAQCRWVLGSSLPVSVPLLVLREYPSGRAAAQIIHRELARRHDPRRAVGTQAAECPVRPPRSAAPCTDTNGTAPPLRSAVCASKHPCEDYVSAVRTGGRADRSTRTRSTARSPPRCRRSSC